MFNVLIAWNPTQWETDQLMRMDVARFKEYSGSEAKNISPSKPTTLKLLQGIDTLLMYEANSKGPSRDLVRYGCLHDIRVVGQDIVFRFEEKGKFLRPVVEEFARRLGFGPLEENRTHWAVKDAGIPKAMLDKLMPSYDLVFSFAGEDRPYVNQVAEILKAGGVSIFYDGYEEANLWGKDLVEHLQMIFSGSARYCVMFISKRYAEKAWPTHERRSAFEKAVESKEAYVLPARFDDTPIPGLHKTVHYIDLRKRTPDEVAVLILQKLGRPI